MNEPGHPFRVAPGGGRALRTPAGGQVRFKVRAAESSGRISIAEFEVPAGAGPRRHVHEDADECIYVLESELLVQLGNEAHHAPSRSCVFIPRGLPHSFRNVGEAPASLLAVYSPGGIEEFFENVAVGKQERRGGATPGGGTPP